LLNAILYGNTNESLNPRKFQRGRTPQGAKLPKGVKAITSAKPGETKELSFYQLTSDVMARSDNEVSTDETADTAPKSKKQKQLVSKMSLLLVDLPGYGFAFAKEERTKEWQELMHHYLLERRSLKRILLLLDARHGFKQTDFDFLGNLQDGLLERNLEGKVRDMFRVSVSFSLSYTCPTPYLFYRPARENFLRYK
jgi:GTP-binding protein